MFDILVYLFENYYHPEACPEPAALARKLSAVGFEEEDISAALGWLSDMDLVSCAEHRTVAPHSLRIYCEVEQARLPLDCRGFLTFLENVYAIDPSLRETIIERALALPETAVSLGKLKIIVLMVLWRHNQSLDTLLLEELLFEDGDGYRLSH